MDYRLYILAGSFVFLIVSVLLLILTTARAHKASGVPDEPDVSGNWPMLKPAPEEIEASIRETFSEPTSGVAAVLNEPIRTGAWQPEPAEQDAKSTPPRSDYWDALIEEPSLLMRERTEPEAASAPEAIAPEPIVSAAPDTIEEPEPESLTGPAPAPPAAQSVSTVAATVVKRASQDAEIDHMIEELVEEPAAEIPAEKVAEASEPVLPARPSAPTPPSLPEPVPVAPVAPPAQRVPSAPSEPTPPPEPESAPDPIPVTLSEQPAAPVSEPVSTPVAVPASPVATPVQAPAGAQTARVTPVPAAQRAVTQQRREVPSARRQVVAPVERPQARIAGERPESIPEHDLVAPIEMWFGDDRVGVKPGSRTYDLFQKYARVLLDDLRRSGTSTPV